MFVEEKAKGEVPDFKLGTLRLSTAIRIGATKRPQCTGDWFTADRSCALGAAWEGYWGDRRESPVPGEGRGDALYRLFKLPAWAMDEILTRNDKLGHTREQIADYLESRGL